MHEVRVARAFIQNDAGALLMLRRTSTQETFPGYWYVPGGKVGEGETLESALVREVREELGVEVEAGEPFHSVDFFAYETMWHIFAFRARVISGTPRNLEPDVHDRMEWVPIDQVEELQPQIVEQVAEPARLLQTL